MRRATIALLTATTALALAGCGGDPAASATPASTSASTPAPATAAATVTAQPEDAAGKGNCIAAGLAYAPISSALDGSVGLDQAVQYFKAADVDAATSKAGKDAAMAIAEANLELALAKANAVTGQPVDAAKLQTLLAAVDTACKPVLAQ